MTEKAPARGHNRMVLLLIAGIPVTMVLAATWLWFFVASGELDLVDALGTANRGSLVQPPRQIDDTQILDQEGAPLRYRDLEPRWAMVTVAAEHCDAACEGALYLTRQVHVALGKDFNRIRRLLVSERPLPGIPLQVDALSDGSAAPGDLAALLAGEHDGVRALRLSAGGVDRLFGEVRQDNSTWYLVDPAGWIMMSYNSGTGYKDVIADMKFLLKNSGG